MRRLTHLITTLWSMGAAAALTLAAVHGLVWLMDRKSMANLLFSVVALAVAGLVPLELGVMHSATPAECIPLARWVHVPLLIAMIGLVLFVKVHLGTGKAWLAWSFISIRVVLLVVNFLVYPNINWSSITSMKEAMFFGEKVYVFDRVVVRSWQWLGSMSLMMLAVYVFDASITLWRKGGADARRKAAVIGGGMMGFVIVSSMLSQLLVWGVVKIPVLLSPPFLILMCAMAFELCQDIFVSRRAQLESEQLRHELAHASRVSMMGQLASALAHELNQPLGAGRMRQRAG